MSGKRAVIYIVTLVFVFTLLGKLIASSPGEKIAFLDVGQGDSTLLQQGNRQILVDGGPGMTVLRRLGEELPWFDRTIEMVVLTHPEQDHMEGLIHVLKRYKVQLVLMPKETASTPLFEAWIDELRQQKIAYRFAEQGQSVTMGDIKLQVLYPGASDQPTKSANDLSVVSRIDFHDLSLLLTGDISEKIEKRIIARTSDELLNIDLLKIPHHGSKTSTSDELLGVTSPAVATISVGEQNRYGHPHADVLNRLKILTVWRTDEKGTVRLLWIKNGWRVAFAG